MAVALTYRTSECAGKLRTVVVEDVRQSVILLPQGSMDVLVAKQLHGTTCRCQFWDEVLGTTSDDLVIAREQIVQIRELVVAVKVKHCKVAAR